MKLIYVVIDGMSDLPIEELGNRTPLEAAYTPNMDFLAETGKTGLMYTVEKGVSPESDVAVVSVLGYDPFRYNASRGPMEAFGAGLTVKDGDLALRCNFATLGGEKKIIDRRVGRTLTTEEATRLTEAINKNVRLKSYPVSFEFKNTTGHRGTLVIRSKQKPLSSNISNTDPAYARVRGLGVAKPDPEMILKECKATENTDKAEISARLVNEFIKRSREVLDDHEVNKTRVARGKLSANIILTRDAGHRLPRFVSINERYGFSFVCLADMPIERGISKLAGMHTVHLPPPSLSLEKDCELRVKRLLEVLSSYDCFYIHIKGPDEPGHDGNFILKTNQISTIDKHFFEGMLQKIKTEDYIICVTADHSTPCKLKTHSDDPVPLLITGNKIKEDKVKRFCETECKEGSLGILRHGTELMPKLIAHLKK